MPVTTIRVLPSGEIILKQDTGASTATSSSSSPSAAVGGSVSDVPYVPRTSADPSTPLVDLGIKMCVFDMAGTTVDEGGIVYKTLKQIMVDAGLKVDDAEFDKWHGANKREVIAHFVKTNNAGDEGDIDNLYKEFEEELEAVYFSPNSPVKPIPGIKKYFTELRRAGIKIGLDTGFPRKIASHIIDMLGFGDYVDGSCVAMEVGHGRPYPFMIYRLMNEHGIGSISEVAKMGDTVRDIEEGLAAGTPYVYGCLSGADDEQKLMEAGAFSVVKSVCDIPIVGKQKRSSSGASGSVKRSK